MNINNKIIFTEITFICLIFDQISKFIANEFLNINQHFVIIKNILSFEKLYNTGGAFSIFQNNTNILSLISIITLIIILFFIIKYNSKLNILDTIALGFIAGGAWGNLIDRLIHSYVIDFIQLDFIHFPVFNLADIFINIGVIILIVGIFINKNNEKFYLM